MRTARVYHATLRGDGIATRSTTRGTPPRWRLRPALAAGVVAALPGWVERSVPGPGRPGTGVDASVEAPSRRRPPRRGRGRCPACGRCWRPTWTTSAPTRCRSCGRWCRTSRRPCAAAGARPWPRRVQRAELPRRRLRPRPAPFADVDPSLHEPGLVWGAAKATSILARRRRRGATAEHPGVAPADPHWAGRRPRGRRVGREGPGARTWA